MPLLADQRPKTDISDGSAAVSNEFIPIAEIQLDYTWMTLDRNMKLRPTKTNGNPRGLR